MNRARATIGPDSGGHLECTSLKTVKTAKALGLTIPPSLLLRADQVIAPRIVDSPHPRKPVGRSDMAGREGGASTCPGAAPRGGESALVELNRRLATLRAALGFLTLERREPELRLLHRYAGTWRGVGDVVAGMARHEYDLELRLYDGKGWRAMFFPSGFEHSLTAHVGTIAGRLDDRCGRPTRRLRDL